MSNLELVPPDPAGTSNSTDLTSYLEFLYGGLDGYVAAATKSVQVIAGQKSNIVNFNRQYFQWPAQRQQLTDWIISESPQVDVYLAPAIFDSPNGHKEHFKATNVVWIDLDDGIPTAEQQGTIPDPSLRVLSGGEDHEHWYWRLTKPSSDAALIEGINRSLMYQLGADSSGWDIGQVLRPPDSYNHKRESVTKTVSLSYSLTVDPTTIEVAAPTQQVVVEIDPSVIPDVTDVILKYPFPKEMADLYRSSPVERSDNLMRLGYDAARIGMSDAEIYSLIRNADDRWGKFKDRDDRVQRLNEIISIARAKYPIDHLDLTEDAIPLFGLRSFLNTEVEISWIIPGLLQEQGYMLLTGPAGVGKTQFSLRWAIHLALGLDFLGHKITDPVRVLVWSLEMGHADLKYFLSTMARDFTDEELLLLEQNLIIAPIGEAYYFDQEETQQQFREVLKVVQPKVAFIDSVGSSSSGSISEETTVKRLMDYNDSIRNEFGLATWFIHHNRKAQGDNKKPNKLSDVYGNQYLVNRATSVYCLWPDGNGIQVIPLKKRLAAMEDPWAITRFGNLDFQVKESTALTGFAPKLVVLDEADVIHPNKTLEF